MPAVPHVLARARPPRARPPVAAVGGHGGGAGNVREVPVRLIRRPLHGARPGGYDQAKIKGLMESIEEVGLLEPIDVLEVAMDDGSTAYYGFSGCHRYEAHVRLGWETIKCRVRKATQRTLQMHLR